MFITDSRMRVAGLTRLTEIFTNNKHAKDVNPGAGDSSPDTFAVLNGELSFFADDSTSGIELWKTDGTATGTVLLKDICPGPCSSR